MRGLRSVLVLLATLAVVGASAPAALAGTSAPKATRVADVFHAIPISGTTANGGTLTGTFEVRRFVAANGKLYAVGLLDAVVKNAAGDVVKTITDQLVRIPLTAQGTCQILHLTLGPLDLDLLGLRVHLNRVVLDITAVAGPGRLLGNLLCSIAHLLDRNRPLAGVANQLNKLLRLGQLLQNISLTGTTANGGSFTGTFDVQRIVLQNGKLAAVGTVTGVVKNAAGDVIKTITNQVVTVPLQANGTCQILHLTLGPLDLDLLGLRIHLNRVVLDITAQSGPGKLLGNLLCSIAHLLDQNNLQAVANQLNRLLVVRR